jgi:hypothetical protein
LAEQVIFGAEPEEILTEEEAAEAEAWAAVYLHRMFVRAVWATLAFTGTTLAVVPFLLGHSLHAYWETVGKIFLVLDMAELPVMVICWSAAFGAWRIAHETQRNGG